MDVPITIMLFLLLLVLYWLRRQQYQRRLWRDELGASKRGAGYVYAWQDPRDSKHTKWGRAKNWKDRMKAFQTAQPEPINVRCVVRVRNPAVAEKVVHDKFAEQRLTGRRSTEWFKTNRAMQRYARLVTDNFTYP